MTRISRVAFALGLAALAACTAPAPEPAPEPAAAPEPAPEAPPAAEPAVLAPDPGEPAPSRPRAARLEIFDLGEQATDRLRPLAPLEKPNRVRAIDVIELAGERGDFDPAEHGVLARITGRIVVEGGEGEAMRLVSSGPARLRVEGLESVVGGPDAPATLSVPAGERAFELVFVGDARSGRVALERPGDAKEWMPLAGAVLALEPGSARATAPGEKRLLSPLARTRPGDGMELAGIPPSYAATRSVPVVLQGPLRGMQTLADGRVAVVTGGARGEVWFIDPDGASAAARPPKRFAAGLDDPRGIAIADGRVFVLQRLELVELIDRDRDDSADEYRTLASGWKEDVAATAGLVVRDGVLRALTVPGPGVLEIALADGTWQRRAAGLRAPRCLGATADGTLVCVETSGVPALARLADGARAVQLVEGAQIDSLATFGEGPFAGQLLLADTAGERLLRVQLDQVDGALQGTLFRFAGVPGPAAACASAAGALQFATVGAGRTLRDAVRLAPGETPLFDLAAVRARSDGLLLEFTQPLAPGLGWEPENYELATLSGSAAEPLVVRAASVAEDRRSVSLAIPGLAAGRVVHLRVAGPLADERGERLWGTEAWCTLGALPRDLPVDLRARPADAPHNALSADEVAQGWKLLFDGVSTAGWRTYGKPAGPPAGWAAVDGALARVEPGGDIVTDEEYGSFELELEWKLAPGGNSGIFFHVGDGHEWVFQTGPEMQVLDDARHPDGQDPRTSAGANYALVAPERAAAYPPGLWNRARLVVRGAHVEHWLNGAKLLEYELWSPQWQALVAESKFAAMPDYGTLRTGRIALQDHGDAVWFRDVRIRPLSDP